MPNKLEKALKKQDKSKQDTKTELSGKLGVRINDTDIVEVPGRNGFHYVYLNENKELVQAFNDKTSPIFGLPVIVVWNVNRYEVQEIDKRRYGTWNSNYLPKHGSQHSFNPEGGGAGDVAFIYGRQIVPLSLTPSGTFGAPVAIIASYPQLQSGWHFIPNTTTPDIVTHKPTDGQARMVLVCMDWDTRVPQLILGGTSFSSSLTGSADVIPYLPSPTGVNQVPIAGVRLVSGTTAVTWQNIYDVRQFFHPIITGSSGGGGGGSSTDTIGFAGLDEGIPIGTGTFLNVVGAGATFSRSGTMFELNIPGGGGIGSSNGIVGWDEGIYQATGTILNVTGQRATLSASGTVLNLNISPDPQELIGIYAWDDGVPIGTGTTIDFGNNLTASLSGTVLRIDASGSGTNYLQNLLDVSITGLLNYDILVFNSGTGKWENVHPESDAPFDGNIYGRQTGTWVIIPAGGGGGTFGIMGWDEGIPLGTGTVLNVRGSRASLSRSGTVLALDISPDPQELIGFYGLANGIPLGTGTWLNIGNNLTATLSGTTLRLDANTQAGGGGNTYPAIYDDGVFIATGTSISFNTNLTVTASGTSVTVTAPITTYFRVGQPAQLSGNFWQVPDRVYASGSLGLFNNGHALTPGVDYVEQLYVSGTYQYLSSFTGTHLAMYGVPCSPQAHIPTGSSSQFDLLDSSSVSLLDSNGIQLMDSNG